MSRHWHGRHYRKYSPEQILFIVLGLFVMGIIYEPSRPILTSFWYIYVFFGIVALIVIALKINREIKISKAGIHEIDVMTGSDFEIFLTSLFSKLGYKVKHTGHSGDYGADLIIEKDNRRIAVQAKRYKSHVGIEAIQQVIGVLKLRNCSKGIVVTNNYFTKEAKVLAEANNINLWNRDVLVDEILRATNNKTITNNQLQNTINNNDNSTLNTNSQT